MPYYLKQVSLISKICIIVAGSYSSIIMLTAVLMLEHALIASN
jgi:hypothetical protein